jgi:hypothetical protein
MGSAERPVAVVTGAGSGIGRATALALGARDLDVVCAGRRPGPLQETAGQLGGGRGRAVAADIAAAEGVRAIAAAVGGRSVMALVHAAAIEGIVSLADTTRPVFDRLVAVNLAGPFFLTQALRPMLADGSGIVFVSSVSALHGRPRHAAYAATKAALLGLSTQPRRRAGAARPGQLRGSGRHRHSHDGRGDHRIPPVHGCGGSPADRDRGDGEGPARPGGQPGGTGCGHRPPGTRCQLQHWQRCHRGRGLQRQLKPESGGW